MRGATTSEQAALDTARRHDETQERLRQTETLVRVGHAISSTLDPTEVMRRVAREAARALGPDMVGAYLADADGAALRPVAGYRVPVPLREKFRSHPIPLRGHRFLEEAWTGHRAVSCTDAKRVVDPETFERFPHRSLLFVPMVVKDAPIGGFFLVWWERPRQFRPEDGQIAEAIARQAGVAVEAARLYAETERRRREAEALAEVARTLAETLDLDLVSQRITESVCFLLDARGACIYRIDADTGALRSMAVTHNDGPAAVFWAPVLAVGTGLAGLALREGRPMTSPDIRADPRVVFAPEARATVEHSADRAILAVPLLVQDRPFGVLAVGDLTGRRFTDEEARLARLFAGQATLALQNARLYEETEQRRREAEVVAALSSTISDSLDVDTVLQRIVEGARELCAADTARISLREAHGAALVAHYSVGHRVDASPGLRLEAGRGVAGKVLATGRPCRVDDYTSDPGITKDYADVAAAEGIVAYMAVPITIAGRVEGTIQVGIRSARRFTDHDEATLARLADHAAIALRNARSFAREQAARAEAQASAEALRLSEERFRQAQKMEAIGRLAGGVAHDFNNMLTVIDGRCQLVLSRLPADAGPRRDLEIVRDAARRASALTRQLLAFSRKQVLQPKVLDLNEVVTGMSAMLRRLIGEHIELETVRAPGLWPVQADPSQLEQVVMNLVINARDAMPSGGHLTVRTANAELDAGHAREHPGSAAGPHVLLAVTDTGHGMDAETQAKVFEPFFTTKAAGKGTGLGLSTVFGIVTQSGGHIALASEPGRGTVVTIHLPRAQATDAPHAASPAGGATLRGSETVLLVEDEASVRDLAREILEAQGYTLVTAPTGPDALALLRIDARPVDLMLTDVVMPHMSGRDLADRVTALRPGVRVLFMSGYTDDAIAHHGVLEPGTTLLEKPFTPDALSRKVRQVLDSR